MLVIGEGETKKMIEREEELKRWGTDRTMNETL